MRENRGAYMKYKIVTEASVDMPKEFAKENDITICPIELNFNGELYPEGLPNEEFYEKMRTTGIIPKTSQPNQYKFESAFEGYVNKPDWFVLTIVISSDLAGTIAQAKNAVENLNMKNCYVCDSRCTTFAEGALIMEIVKYIKSHPNAKPQEVIDELERLKGKVRLLAVVGDLKYLKQGGRLSGAAYIAASALNIKPIISLDGGKVNTVAKKVGEKAANQFMVDYAKKRDKDYPIYFGYSANKANAIRFISQVADQFGIAPETTPLYDIGCVVGTHAGPNCYGLVYFA